MIWIALMMAGAEPSAEALALLRQEVLQRAQALELLEQLGEIAACVTGNRSLLAS